MAVRALRRDPRLRLLVVIGSIHVLGQTLLGFKLSIAQILITVAVCSLIEAAVVFLRNGRLIWPASAMQTGNSIALILRAAGTRHGDWWSLNGIEWFLLAAAIAMGSKFLIRPGGRHLFNPSNIGIVLTLLLVGVTSAFPQYLWWGPPGPVTVPGPEQLITWIVILTGAWWVLKGLRMLPMIIAFTVPFVLIIAVLAATGNCFVAIWHRGQICGPEYWAAISASPELAIFVFFMMSDPKTAPRSPAARAIYGSSTAAAAAILISVQGTEFGVKLGLLAGLTLVCCLTPAFEWIGQWWHGELGEAARPIAQLKLGRLASPAIVAVAVIGLAVPSSVVSLAENQQLISIESGHSSLGSAAQ